MADTTLTAITAALAQNYRDPIIRTFNGRSRALSLFKVMAGEGKNCAWTWTGTGAIGENHAEGADVSSTGSNAASPAVLSWGLYRSNFLVTDLAASAARTSRTPVGSQMKVAENVMEGSQKLASVLNGAFYTGAGTGTLLCGLDVAIDDANTYAGVDRSVGANSGFRATVIDPGAPTAPTLALLRSDLASIYDVSGETPDIALCPTAVWQKIAALYDENRRYVQQVTTGKGLVTLDGSAGALELDGCVFIKDKDATANQIKYVNSNYVHFEYLPFFDEGQIRDLMHAGDVSLDDGYGPMPFGMMVRQLGPAGAARKYTMQLQMQLVVKKPSACGVRKNVST